MRPILWFSSQPTPYNDVLFRALASEPGISLTVIYKTPVRSSHPWRTPLGTGYSTRYYRCVFGIDWASLLLPLGQPQALFVIAGWDHPTTILLLALLVSLRRRYLIWTDTPNVARPRSRLKAWARERFLRWVFWRAHRVLATGEVGVSTIISMGAPPERSVCFPFWLELDRYRRHGRDAHGGAGLRFISSGRLIQALKGHDLALRALASAMAGCPEPWEYVIAGTGSDRLGLAALASELGIAHHVRFAGWVEPSDLINLYVSSDVLIHPSPAHDPFPNAVLEGMAAGCVVMASDVCGSALDRIENGVNGYLHAAGDWRQLANQIREVVANPASRLDVARRGRLTAEQWPVRKGVELIKASAA